MNILSRDCTLRDAVEEKRGRRMQLLTKLKENESYAVKEEISKSV